MGERRIQIGTVLADDGQCIAQVRILPRPSSRITGKEGKIKMSGEAKYEVIVVFPSELRVAAKAMAHLRKGMDEDKESLIAELNTLVIAVERALYHLMQPGAAEKCLMLAAEPESMEMERAVVERKKRDPKKQDS